MNKYASLGPQVSEVVNTLLSGVKHPIGQQDFEEKQVRLLFWIGKGLVTKGDKSVVKLLPNLVGLLSCPLLGSIARRGFEVIFGDNEFINQKNYAVISRLGKQKAFALSVPEIVDGFKSAQAGM